MGLACQILLATSEDAIFDKKLKMRVDDMARYICQVLGSGGGEHRFGSVFVTFSGRTPATFRAALHRHLAMRLVRPTTSQLMPATSSSTTKNLGP